MENSSTVIIYKKRTLNFHQGSRFRERKRDHRGTSNVFASTFHFLNVYRALFI